MIALARIGMQGVDAGSGSPIVREAGVTTDLSGSRATFAEPKGLSGARTKDLFQ